MYNKLLIKSGVLIIIGFMGLVGFQYYIENKPDNIITPTETVDALVHQIVERDSLMYKKVKVLYHYTPAVFDATTSKSYWWFKAEATKKDGSKVIHTKSIEFDVPFFDFYTAGRNINHKNEYTQVFITNFHQISEASLASYNKYARD